MLISPLYGRSQNGGKAKWHHIGQFAHTEFPFYKIQKRQFILPDSLERRGFSASLAFDCNIDSLGKILSVMPSDIHIYKGKQANFRWRDSETVINALYNRSARSWGKDSVKIKPYVQWAETEFWKTIRIRRKKGPPHKGDRYFPAISAVNFVTVSIRIR